MTCEIWHGDAVELAHELPNDIACVVTDPPYGMAYQSGRATTPEGKALNRAIASDGDLGSAIALFLDVMDVIAPKMATECDLYVFCRWSLMEAWREAVNSLEGFEVQNCLVWNKELHGMGDLVGDWALCHEFILYAKRGRRPVSKRRPNVITVERLHAAEMTHPTEKPVGLLERIIEVSSDRGDLIVDPFSGSGSTIKAAQNLGRRGIGIELDANDVESSRNRLDQLSLL